MQNFAGMLEYLLGWRWWTESGIVRTHTGFIFSASALPFRIDDAGEILRLGSEYLASVAVFASRRDAFFYIRSIAKRDLQYRGFRDDRVRCFEHKQEANFLLYRRILQCPDADEYECLRQLWDTLNRPKYRDLCWSPEQQEAVDLVKKGVSYEDEEQRVNSRRWLYIDGPPGSGKSAVLLFLTI